MAMAHRKWGKLPWADLFQPAIHLAEGGFEVNEVLHGRLERMAALWKEFPKAQAPYWREGGPAPVGAIIKNSELASFLKELAAEGPDAFYTGDNAEEIDRTSVVQGKRVSGRVALGGRRLINKKKNQTN